MEIDFDLAIRQIDTAIEFLEYLKLDLKREDTSGDARWHFRGAELTVDKVKKIVWEENK